MQVNMGDRGRKLITGPTLQQETSHDKHAIAPVSKDRGTEALVSLALSSSTITSAAMAIATHHRKAVLLISST
jgi:hypothetical protein